MMTTEVHDYYVAGLLDFNGYRLTEIRTQHGSTTAFVFQINPWSVDEIQEAYDSPEGQPITDVKRYVESLKKLQTLQKKARASRDGLWVSRSWQTMGKETDEGWRSSDSEPVDCGKF